jgi:hypothetical protein
VCWSRGCLLCSCIGQFERNNVAVYRPSPLTHYYLRCLGLPRTSELRSKALAILHPALRNIDEIKRKEEGDDECDDDDNEGDEGDEEEEDEADEGHSHGGHGHSHGGHSHGHGGGDHKHDGTCCDAATEEGVDTEDDLITELSSRAEKLSIADSDESKQLRSTSKGDDGVDEDDEWERLLPPLEGFGLYRWICRMNHSCDANTRILYTPPHILPPSSPFAALTSSVSSSSSSSSTTPPPPAATAATSSSSSSGSSVSGNNGRLRAYLYAVRDIAAGEELCHSYIDHTQPLAERRNELADYGFICTCTECTEQSKSTAKKSKK